MGRFHKLLAITAALLVAAVAVCGCQSFAPATDASSTNFQISSSEMNLYRHDAVKEDLRTEYVYFTYGMIPDVNGVSGLFKNAEEYAIAMLPERLKTANVHQIVSAKAQTVLAYCEYALEAGLYEQFKADTAWEVDVYMEDVEKQAEELDLSLSKYLTTYYGSGSTKDSIRQAKEYQCIAEACREKLTLEHEQSATMEELKHYVQEHKGSFYTSSYTSYKLVNTNLLTLYDIDKCMNVQEVQNAILRYFVDVKFDSLYKTNITDKKLDGPGKDQTKADVLTTVLVLQDLADKDTEAVFSQSDTDPFKKAAFSMCEAILHAARVEFNKIRESTAYWVDPADPNTADLKKWLFGEGRKAGDMSVIREQETVKDSTTGKDVTMNSYTWILAGDDIMKLDTDICREACYHLFRDDAEGAENQQTAAQKAEAFLAELKAHPSPKLFEQFPQDTFRFVMTPFAKNPSPPTISGFTSYKGDVADSDSRFFTVSGATTDDSSFSYGEVMTGGTNPSFSLVIPDDKFIVVDGDFLANANSSPLAKGKSYDQLSSTDKDLADWVFDSNRKAGDMVAITVEKGVYVALYVSENGERWEMEARAALAEEKMAAHLKELLVKYSVRIGTDAVETEETTTSIFEISPIG